MKRKRFAESQIIGILKEGESGIKVDELCRKYGMAQATYYAWKAKFGGMEIDDISRLRALEEENRRLKHMVADQALDIQMLRAVHAKKW